MKFLDFFRLMFLCLSASATFAQSDVLPAPKNGHIYVIAHRGVHLGIPENSLPAYQRAIDLGCDFVEIDVRTTKDKKIVSIHNADIDAYVIGQTGKVSSMTLAELRSLDIGLKIGPEWENTRIPTLEEILELCQGKIGIYLDLKDADVEQLVSVIRNFNMEEQIVWYIPAFRHKTLMEIMRICPKCLIMPDPGPAENIERVMTAYRPKVIATDTKHLSKEFAIAVHNGEASVFADDSEDDPKKKESEWINMIRIGTDGIQTDHPEELIGYLRKNDQR